MQRLGHLYSYLLLASLALTACQKGTKSEATSSPEASVRFTPPVVADAAEAEQPEAADAATGAAAPAPPPPAQTQEPAAPAAIPKARLLIYHAEVRLKTERLARAARGLDSLVRRAGGFVSASSETRQDGEWRQETTIRVPPARFQGLLSGLSGLGTVEEKKLSTDDVTAEHADVSARLAAKRAVEKQYTALLSRAGRIKDILDVEEKLGEVREEIEATESRLKTLNDEVAYSTITLTLYQPLPLTVPDAPVVSVGSRLVDAFYGGWQLLIGLLIGLVNLWPLLLLASAGVWLWRRRRAQRGVTGQPGGGRLPMAEAPAESEGAA